MTPAIFGITNSGLNLIVSLLVLSLIAIWLSLIYWTYEDARRRIEDPALIWIFTAWSLFPFVGSIIYTIIRPPEFLEDVREREAETQAAEARLHMIKNRTCSNCGYEVEPSYLRCPSCLRKLKEPCESCGKPLDPRWRVCPFCETENKRAVSGRPAAGRRSRGREPDRAERTERAPEQVTERPESVVERPAARRQAAAQRPRPAEVPSAAERQRRSLASVKTEPNEPPSPAARRAAERAAAKAPEKPEAPEAQRMSASEAIVPKRDATAKQPAASKKGKTGGTGKRAPKRAARKSSSKRSKP